MINLHDFKSAYYKRKWRNWYTRTFEGRVPKGLRVRVPPCAPVFIGVGWFGSTRFVVIAAVHFKKSVTFRFFMFEVLLVPIWLFSFNYRWFQKSEIYNNCLRSIYQQPRDTMPLLVTVSLYY